MQRRQVRFIPKNLERFTPNLQLDVGEIIVLTAFASRSILPRRKAEPLIRFPSGNWVDWPCGLVNDLTRLRCPSILKVFRARWTTSSGHVWVGNASLFVILRRQSASRYPIRRCRCIRPESGCGLVRLSHRSGRSLAIALQQARTVIPALGLTPPHA